MEVQFFSTFRAFNLYLYIFLLSHFSYPSRLGQYNTPTTSLQVMLYSHLIYIHLHAEHNDTIKTSDTVLRKIYLSLYLKGFWRSEELEIRHGRENQHPEWLGPQAPGWAAQENGKETRLWPIEWGSICFSSVWSPTPSHTQPFQIKWEVYFSKELCRSSLLCRCVLHTDLHAYVDVYVSCICIDGHGYTRPVASL